MHGVLNLFALPTICIDVNIATSMELIASIIMNMHACSIKLMYLLAGRHSQDPVL